MAKVTFKGQVFTGVLVDESATHYTIEIDGDQVSFDKELTTIENAEVSDEVIEVIRKEILERFYKKYPNAGNGWYKFTYFLDALKKGLLPLSEVDNYKKYTVKQLGEIHQAGK